MYQIEKSVPIQEIKPPNYYPFSQLEVGDSFLVPDADKKKIASVRACASTFAKKSGRKLVCKKAEGGVRVWRTA